MASLYPNYLQASSHLGLMNFGEAQTVHNIQSAHCLNFLYATLQLWGHFFFLYILCTSLKFSLYFDLSFQLNINFLKVYDVHIFKSPSTTSDLCP
jgi:hypothetical protein